MLGKLFKYEFKNTAKLMLTIYGLLIVTTIFGSIGLSTDVMQTGGPDSLSPVGQIIFMAGFMLYFMSIFALFFVTYIYVCIHFYKTMYSEQGYLTHTLPVKPTTLFNVKLTTSWVWMMGAISLFFLSLFFVTLGATRGEILTASKDVSFTIVSEQFETVMGMHIIPFCLLMFVLMAFSCVSYLLMVYASISIGQLFNQHKIVWAIVAGLVINFIMQIVSSIILLVTGGSFFEQYMYADNVTFAEIMFSTPMIVSAVTSILFTVAFYVICIIIQKKHINLD